MIFFKKNRLQRDLTKLVKFIAGRVQRPLSPISLAEDAAVRSSYEHFNEYFRDALLFRDSTLLLLFALREALGVAATDGDSLFLEFGVLRADSLNISADFLSRHGRSITGFDSFEGLEEDWVGAVDNPRGSMNQDGRLPLTSKNASLEVGWVEDTLPTFLTDSSGIVAYAHLDMDTYTPTRFALEVLKPRLASGSIVLFDELYGYPNWEHHEYRALGEVFRPDEFTYIGFSNKQAAIRIL